MQEYILLGILAVLVTYGVIIWIIIKDYRDSILEVKSEVKYFHMVIVDIDKKLKACHELLRENNIPIPEPTQNQKPNH